MPVTPDITVVEQHIIELTNEFRATHKRGAVRSNPVLDRAAEAYAAFLAKSGDFSHTADGRKPAERVESAGYRFCQVSENLASALDSRGFKSNALALQMVEGWINSPGHRKNLLAPDVKEIGIAVARVADKHPKYVSVQLFGRPKSEMFTFQVSNATKSTITYSFAGETHSIGPSYAFSHSSCEPGDVTFLKSGKDGRVKKLTSKYKARDGQIYTVSTARDGTIEIKVKAKERLRPRPEKNAKAD